MNRAGRGLLRAGVALGLLAGALPLTGASPAAAGTLTTDEVYPVPGNGVFVMDGHGWGHGHGLSQWGAQGAASIGKTATQILSFYYPGTATASIGQPAIRVALTESGTEGYQPYATYPDARYQCDSASANQLVNCNLTVLPETGLVATDLATGAHATLATNVSRWAVTVDSAGLHLKELTSTGWHVVALGGRTSFAGPVRLSGPTFIDVRYEDGSVHGYRGYVQAARTGTTRMVRVNGLPMDSYLDGVVPRESPSSWYAAALQAQAVAARSYADYERVHAGSGATYDICDSTWCQMYEGATIVYPDGSKYSLEAASSNSAVSATAGQVRTYGGQVIFSQFSSSNGGWTTDGGQPYLIAQADAWDTIASPYHNWKGQVSAAQLQAAYPAVGRLLRLVVTSRDGNGDWGGRVLGVRLEGVDGSGNATAVTTTGDAIAAVNGWPGSSNGMLGSWWTVDPSSLAPAFHPPAPPVGVWTTTGTLDTFGVAANQQAIQRRMAGVWWHGLGLGGGLLGHLAATSAGADQPVLFGEGTDGALWWKQSSAAGVWTGWTRIGGSLSSSPNAASDGAGHTLVVARWSAGNAEVISSTSTGWGGWTDLHGGLASGNAPAIASPVAGTVVVFVRAGNGYLYQDIDKAGVWSGWQLLNERPAGDAAAVPDGAGGLLLFVRDANNDLWTATWSAGRVGSWQFLGNTLGSDPTAAAKPDGSEQDVFCWSSNGYLSMKRHTSAGWSAWYHLPLT